MIKKNYDCYFLNNNNYYYFNPYSVGLKYGICFVGVIIITLIYLMAYLLMFHS